MNRRLGAALTPNLALTMLSAAETLNIHPKLSDISNILSAWSGNDQYDTLMHRIKSVQAVELIYLLNEGRHLQKLSDSPEQFECWKSNLDPEALLALTRHHEDKRVILLALDIYLLLTVDYSHIFDLLLANKVYGESVVISPDLLKAAAVIVKDTLDNFYPNNPIAKKKFLTFFAYARLKMRLKSKEAFLYTLRQMSEN